MKSSLAEIVIHNIEFFELALDSDINPDVAVRQLELIATLLKKVPEAELAHFLTQVDIRLEKLKEKGASQEHIDLLSNIRENLGIGG